MLYLQTGPRDHSKMFHDSNLGTAAKNNIESAKKMPMKDCKREILGYDDCVHTDGVQPNDPLYGQNQTPV
jgi:hypothetical protein